MAITYLKKSPKTSSSDDTKTREIVENILKDIEQTKEEGCKELSKKFDKYEGDVIVSKEKIEEIKNNLDQKTKDDIQFSHERVRKFAEAQLKNYGQDFEVELSDGLYAGQKLVPVNIPSYGQPQLTESAEVRDEASRNSVLPRHRISQPEVEGCLVRVGVENHPPLAYERSQYSIRIRITGAHPLLIEGYPEGQLLNASETVQAGIKLDLLGHGKLHRQTKTQTLSGQGIE